jgi:lipopolysaccharide/colanic/teichoic acid biosynthesis glycosyltransferase
MKTIIVTHITYGLVVLKRTFDIFCSLCGIIITSPVLLAISILIKWEDGGAIFYRGIRVGRHGSPYRIFKFRSMVLNAEKMGGFSSTSDNDPRITKIGSKIRKYKLDEIPQLFNVLAGEMSIVGPRPQVQWAVDLYTPSETMLLNVRPGITDYASIRFRNEAEILLGSADPDQAYLEKIAPEKIRLGLTYVQHRSFWIDLKIILATFAAIANADPDRILGRCIATPAGDTQRRESGPL